ncbi:MAG: hypothetical protein KDE26_27265 [Bacteroidetes bacterium]|nr:hypothetical protein [Bacteroidota bacterium]
MKKISITLLFLLIAGTAWMGFVREPLPPVPEICNALSEEVPLNFGINSMNASGLELSMNQKIGGKGMYVQFSMNKAWKTGRPGLVLNGIKPISGFSGGMAPQKYLNEKGKGNGQGKDFSDFMKDKSGKSISSYTFKQTLVEGTDGKSYMKMTYDGPTMEMIQTLEIPRPVTLPAHVSKQFIDKGIIQFQPGTVAFDGKIKGFYIPVTVR